MRSHFLYTQAQCFYGFQIIPIQVGGKYKVAIASPDPDELRTHSPWIYLSIEEAIMAGKLMVMEQRRSCLQAMLVGMAS